jgi:oxygen-independent coproporphyrinogen-3 oxidase
VILDDDDRARRHVITRLMCDGSADLEDVQELIGAAAGDYFAPELEQLAAMPALCSLDGPVITVTPLGQLLVRNVCLVFDRYAAARRQVASFSSTI